MKLKLTQKDIDKAHEEKDSGCITKSCPVAQVLKREFPGQDVWAGINDVGIDDKEYEMDDNGKRITFYWDMSKKLEPTTFEILGI